MKKVLAVIIAAVLVLSLGACGSKSTPPLQNKKPEVTLKKESPEKVVSKVIDACKKMDRDTITKYVTNSDDFIDAEKTVLDNPDIEYTKLFFKDLSYKVVSTSISGNTAMVKTEITNINTGTAMENHFSSAIEKVFKNAFTENGTELSEEQQDKQNTELLIKCLEDPKLDMVTSTIDIHLALNNDSWVINADDAFADALTGGLISFAQKMSADNDNALKSNEDLKENTETKNTVASIGQTLNCEGLQFTFDSVEEFIDTSSFAAQVPADDKTYILLWFTVLNTTSKDEYLNMFFQDSYCDDISINTVPTMLHVNGESLWGNIAAGKKRVGFVAYEIDKDWKTLEFHYNPSVVSGSSSKVIFKAMKEDIAK